MKRNTKYGAGAVLVLGAAALAWAMTYPGRAGEPPQQDMTIDQALRAQTIERVIAELDAHYVHAETATAVGQSLRLLRQRGAFDAITSAEAFAATLTDTVRRETKDKHIEVRYLEQPIPERTAGQQDSPDEQAAEQLQQLRLNYGFAGYTRMRGNIGLIELRFFGRPPHTAERIAAMMALLADTGALIVDLRRCGGGDPDTVMQFASYLFDAPTHLNDIYWRDENRTEERWTTAAVPGKRYGQTRKIYLLTSGDTFSGCEDFAYALKYSGRATLVGETTGGGAHAGSPQRLGEHFMMFVPSGRPINPVTLKNWEGVGVTPDIATSADAALSVAQIAVLKDLIAVEHDPDWKRRLGEQLATLE